MKRANINSTRPFYVTFRGIVLNDNWQNIKGSYSKKENIHSLNYVELDTGKKKKITLTKLVYQTYSNSNPKECNIVRKNIECEFPYAYYNLEKISLSESPKRNNINCGENLKNLKVGNYGKRKIKEKPAIEVLGRSLSELKLLLNPPEMKINICSAGYGVNFKSNQP